MPFFLVTQTSLVEARDEQEAAQTGVDRLRSGGQVTVSVKSDETTITHVVVAAVVVVVNIPGTDRFPEFCRLHGGEDSGSSSGATSDISTDKVRNVFFFTTSTLG